MSEKKAEFAEIRQVYEVQRCLGNLKLNSVKNKTNIILVNCTRPVGQVVLEMHSSESKTYSSQTSGRVKVFCPEPCSFSFSLLQHIPNIQSVKLDLKASCVPIVTVL